MMVGEHGDEKLQNIKTHTLLPPCPPILLFAQRLALL